MRVYQPTTAAINITLLIGTHKKVYFVNGS
jgi:hypothetical protein